MGALRGSTGVVLVAVLLGSFAFSTTAQQPAATGTLPGGLATAGALAVGIPTGFWAHRECDSGLCDDAFTRGFVLGASLGAGVGWLVGRGVGGGARHLGTHAARPSPGVTLSTGAVVHAAGPDDVVGLGTARLTVTLHLDRSRSLGVEAGRRELGQEVVTAMIDGSGVRRPTDQRLEVRTVGALGRMALTDDGAVSLHATVGVARSRLRETVAVPGGGRATGDIVTDRTASGLHSGVGLAAGWPIPRTGLTAGFEARAEWVSGSRLGALSTVSWSFSVGR